MNAKVMKLMNGEEIIADVKKEENGKITLSSPAKIVMFPSEDEGMGMALMPWFPYSDDEEAIIDRQNIIVTVTPSEHLTNEYNERFGSGIVVPDSDLII
jgi:hypothetical protein